METKPVVRGVETVENGGNGVDRSRIEDGTDHVLFRDEEASAHMRKKAHLSTIYTTGIPPHAVSVTSRNPTLLGVNGNFLGPVPLAEFQVHRHLQPKSRFTDRHDIGNRVLGGGYLLQKCVQSTPKAGPTLDHG